MEKVDLILRIILSCFTILVGMGISTLSANAEDTEEIKWSTFSTPSNESQNGLPKKWILAEGSDVRCLTQDKNGYFYCFANPTGASSKLFKSTDGGYSWFCPGLFQNDIVDIAVSQTDSNYIYVATSSEIFVSRDAGITFNPVTDDPAGPGKNGDKITSLNVASTDTGDHLVAGTCGVNVVGNGKVYTLGKNSTQIWDNNDLGSLDIIEVAFSPDYAEDSQVVVVATDGTDTVITTSFGSGWGASVKDACIDGLVPISAVIAFPSDYSTDLSLDRYTQLIAFDSGLGNNGDVYSLMVQSGSEPVVADLNVGAGDGLSGLDITCLAVNGNAGGCCIMAGAADSAGVYISPDSGQNWSLSTKPPTGGQVTGLRMARDFNVSGLAFAATSGSDSAFSISRDKGKNWVQTGLIDSGDLNIQDLAVSPNYSQDATLFMLTSGNGNSLWHCSNGGSRWERILHRPASSMASFDQVILSPDYSVNRKIYLEGSVSGNPAIWKSEDNGNTFIKSNSIDPDNGTAVSIDAWTITPDDVLFIASFDGENGIVYRIDNAGLVYVNKATAGEQKLETLALSPNYSIDHTLLAGNANGGVFCSFNSGLSFESLPGDTDSQPLGGLISVAFDAGYGENKTIYAAGNGVNQGIYRFVIGQSFAWESIDASLPDDARITRLVSSAPGNLYAVNSQVIIDASTQGGVERSVNPSDNTDVLFETVKGSLLEGMEMRGLWVSGHQVWIKEVNSGQLFTFLDNFNLPVNLISPANGTAGLNKNEAVISWEPLEGNVTYEWQVDTENQFILVPNGFKGNTDSVSVALANVDPNKTYFWRVRAVVPLVSPWSDIRSFDTSLEIGLAAPGLTSPKTGATCPIKPTFKWDVVDGAEVYELQVSEQDDFSTLGIDKSGDSVCHANVWASDVSLAYSTSYYWRVRAINMEKMSPWSAVNSFTTEPQPTSSSSGGSGSGSKSESSPSLTPSPLAAPKLSEPKSTVLASIQPTFKWTAVTGAERYELWVSKNDAFSNLAINKSGSDPCYSNVWKSDVTLECATNYYWKVRAISGDRTSAWSGVDIFTTENTPLPASPSVTPTTAAVKTPPTATSPSSPNLPSGTAAANSSNTTSVYLATASPYAKSGESTNPAAPSPSPGLSESSLRLIFFLVGGLVVLTSILIVVVVIMLKKFKRY